MTPDRLTDRLWLLAPALDAVLLVISSIADFHRLTESYPQRWDEVEAVGAPDWGRLSMETPFDGLHVTAAAVEQLDDAGALPRRWDVESTLWLTWRLTVLGSAGELNDDWTVAFP